MSASNTQMSVFFFFFFFLVLRKFHVCVLECGAISKRERQYELTIEIIESKQVRLETVDYIKFMF